MLTLLSPFIYEEGNGFALSGFRALNMSAWWNVTVSTMKNYLESLGFDVSMGRIISLLLMSFVSKGLVDFNMIVFSSGLQTWPFQVCNKNILVY